MQWKNNTPANSNLSVNQGGISSGLMFGNACHISTHTVFVNGSRHRNDKLMLMSVKYFYND